jgi:hypothetical protein
VDLPPEERGEPYAPPVDPVLTMDARGRPQVLGGFSFSSMDAIDVAPSAQDARPGDEALAEAIRRELREDALTTGLAIEVEVHVGRAHLRGTVAGLEDAEAAEAVAMRVPGVFDVQDELALPDGVFTGRLPRADSPPEDLDPAPARQFGRRRPVHRDAA